MISYNNWTSFLVISQFIASFTNDDEFDILYVLLLSVVWINSTWYWQMLLGGVPIVETIACMESHFFRFVGFYDSIKTWWNRIGRIKLEISSSFKLLLLTKSCKVFLVFTCKCRCQVSVRYCRFSDLFFYFSYGVFVFKNYKTGTLVVRINFTVSTLWNFFKSYPLFNS